MADLNERGQLLLVAAFVLATAIIGLTLVFSASNYTDTLASQESAVAGGDDAVSARESVRSDLRDLLAFVNRGANPPNPASNFRENLTWYGNATGDFFARNGRLVNTTQSPISPTDRFVEGTRLNQSGKPLIRTLSAPDGRPDPGNWTMVNDVRLRNATFNLTAVPDHISDNKKFVFLFNVTDGNNWTVSVYDEGTKAKIAVEEVGGTFRSTCTREDAVTAGGTAAPLVLDLGSATYDGENHCAALEELAPEAPYDLRIHNGSDARGKYWLTVNKSSSNVVSFAATSQDQTNTHDVLYSATVRYRYHAPSVDYAANVTVAPGEIP